MVTMIPSWPLDLTCFDPRCDDAEVPALEGSPRGFQDYVQWIMSDLAPRYDRASGPAARRSVGPRKGHIVVKRTR